MLMENQYCEYWIVWKEFSDYNATMVETQFIQQLNSNNVTNQLLSSKH